MKNIAQYLNFSEISSEKTSELTAGDTYKDSINFVGHPVLVLTMDSFIFFEAVNSFKLD